MYLLLLQYFWTFAWSGADSISIALILELKGREIILTLEEKGLVIVLILEERGRVFRTITNHLQTEVTKWPTRWNATENRIIFWMFVLQMKTLPYVVYNWIFSVCCETCRYQCLEKLFCGGGGRNSSSSSSSTTTTPNTTTTMGSLRWC